MAQPESRPTTSGTTASRREYERQELKRLSQQLSNHLPRPPLPTTTTGQAIQFGTTASSSPENIASYAASSYNDDKKDSALSSSSDVAIPYSGEDVKKSSSDPPDGGYGWAVVAGCATLTFWFGGTTYSWGVMQAALSARGLSSASTLAFIGMQSRSNYL